MWEIGPRLAFLLWGALAFGVLVGLLLIGLLGRFVEALKERWTKPYVTLAMKLNAGTSDEMAAMLKRMEDQGK